MGLTFIEGHVNDSKTQVRFLIDSGATYTLLPKRAWQEAGLTPQREEDFELADGTIVRQPVSEGLISVPQGVAHTPIVLCASDEVEPLLGVLFLEALGLVLNPFERKLQKMKLRI